MNQSSHDPEDDQVEQDLVWELTEVEGTPLEREDPMDEAQPGQVERR
jgi:hypothetical protein